MSTITLVAKVPPPGGVHPRLTLVERHAIVDAIGDPARVRVAWFNVFETATRHLRTVPAGEATVDLGRLEAELDREGFSAAMPDYWPRFKSAVSRGVRHDLFADIEGAF